MKTKIPSMQRDIPVAAPHSASEVIAVRQLTHKQQQFVHNIVNEGMTKTEAYIKAYDHNGKRTTAMEEASRTARKPQVKLELAKYSNLAESKLLEILEYSSEYGKSKAGSKEQGSAYASVAVSVAKDILDRVHGKAMQRQQIESKSVTLTIDLTGVVTEQ